MYRLYFLTNNLRSLSSKFSSLLDSLSLVGSSLEDFELEALRILYFKTSSLTTLFSFFYFSSFFSCLSKKLSSCSCSSNIPNKAVRLSVARFLAFLIAVIFGCKFLVRDLNNLLVAITLKIRLPSKFKRLKDVRTYFEFEQWFPLASCKRVQTLD
ncbi:unnamed protein product [Vicia faba]|uniref:Uncharacterized protein n=1 Tax=Vicia faba TaxID=3906 RepID=A0AAV1B038_VICFA|nr:unnamed protein product [Vicia faba]